MPAPMLYPCSWLSVHQVGCNVELHAFKTLMMTTAVSMSWTPSRRLYRQPPPSCTGVHSRWDACWCARRLAGRVGRALPSSYASARGEAAEHLLAILHSATITQPLRAAFSFTCRFTPILFVSYGPLAGQVSITSAPWRQGNNCMCCTA